MGLFGLSTTANERDFAAVEAYFIDLFRPECVMRVVSSISHGYISALSSSQGYSWGSIAALNAVTASPIRSTLLISPPSSLFTVTSLLSSRTFSKALRQAGIVTIIHGTEDQFTSLSAYQSLQTDSVECCVVQGADHFYRDEHSSSQLQQCMTDWLVAE